jgi:hypothetical protein
MGHSNRSEGAISLCLHAVLVSYCSFESFVRKYDGFRQCFQYRSQQAYGHGEGVVQAGGLCPASIVWAGPSAEALLLIIWDKMFRAMFPFVGLLLGSRQVTKVQSWGSR